MTASETNDPAKHVLSYLKNIYGTLDEESVDVTATGDHNGIVCSSRRRRAGQEQTADADFFLSFCFGLFLDGRKRPRGVRAEEERRSAVELPPSLPPVSSPNWGAFHSSPKFPSEPSERSSETCPDPDRKSVV